VPIQGRKRRSFWWDFPRGEANKQTKPGTSAPKECGVRSALDDYLLDVRPQVRALHTSIKDVTKWIFPSDQPPRLGSPSTAPESTLKALYEHTFGKQSWKITAVNLQAADALDAEKLLQALISAFIHKAILAECEFWKRHKEINTHFLDLGSIEDPDVVTLYHDILLQQLVDANFRNTEIISEAHSLAQELVSTLSAHIDQLDQRTIRLDRGRQNFAQGLRDVCTKALLLRGHIEASDLIYRFDWYCVDNQFDEGAMENNGDPQGEKVAFTTLSGVSWRENFGSEWKVLVKVEVETAIADTREAEA
jgi:hypothetical protein